MALCVWSVTFLPALRGSLTSYKQNVLLPSPDASPIVQGQLPPSVGACLGDYSSMHIATEEEVAKDIRDFGQLIQDVGAPRRVGFSADLLSQILVACGYPKDLDSSEIPKPVEEPRHRVYTMPGPEASARKGHHHEPVVHVSPCSCRLDFLQMLSIFVSWSAVCETEAGRESPKVCRVTSDEPLVQYSKLGRAPANQPSTTLTHGGMKVGNISETRFCRNATGRGETLQSWDRSFSVLNLNLVHPARRADKLLQFSAAFLMRRAIASRLRQRHPDLRVSPISRSSLLKCFNDGD